MRKAITIIILLSLALSTLYYSAAADDVTVNVTVPAAKQMTLSSTTVDFGTVTVGATDTQAFSINVKSNTTWDLQMASNGLLTAGALTISSSQFRYQVDSGGYAEFPTVATSIKSGTKTGGLGQNVAVDYELSIDFNDDPGSYSTTHTYTLI